MAYENPRESVSQEALESADLPPAEGADAHEPPPMPDLSVPDPAAASADPVPEPHSPGDAHASSTDQADTAPTEEASTEADADSDILELTDPEEEPLAEPASNGAESQQEAEEAAATEPPPLVATPAPPLAPVLPLAPRGWAAHIEWYGPFASRQDCAADARLRHNIAPQSVPDFGLYMAVGKLKPRSRLKPKILYIGCNKLEGAAKLWNRIADANHKSLNEIENRSKKSIGNKRTARQVSYWYGHLFGPIDAEIGMKEVQKTEHALIFSLQPVMNLVGLTPPHFRFSLINDAPHTDKRKMTRADRRARADFQRLVPTQILFRNEGTAAPVMKWQTPDGTFRKLSAPDQKAALKTKTKKDKIRLDKNGSKSFVWEGALAERLVDTVPAITGKPVRKPARPAYLTAALALLVTLGSGAAALTYEGTRLAEAAPLAAPPAANPPAASQPAASQPAVVTPDPAPTAPAVAATAQEATEPLPEAEVPGAEEPAELE